MNQTSRMGTSDLEHRIQPTCSSTGGFFDDMGLSGQAFCSGQPGLHTWN
jgi:hypothetical protein